jgi:ApaG protein
MYIKTTQNVKVTAVPTYLEKQSEPAVNHYVWSYTIHIENLGETTVKLQSRYWRITNGIGQLQEVRGEGVVGKKPTLKSGDKYSYTSGAALTTPSGIMVGTYQMVEPDSGMEFEIDIPAFSLDSPYGMMRPN